MQPRVVIWGIRGEIRMASKIFIGAGVLSAIVVGAIIWQHAKGADSREETALLAKSHGLADFLERAHNQQSLDQACEDLRTTEGRLREIAGKTNQSYILPAALRFCPQPSDAKTEAPQ